MRIECAGISLVGDRDDNQDRVAVIGDARATLLVSIDGMGGHSHGARAAECALEALSRCFAANETPLFDPLGFLHRSLGAAHADVVALGEILPIEQRPRATCAVCLVQDESAYWAHIGDSRIYHIRNGAVIARTRDHSHVEGLIRDGRITPAEAKNHPLRNFVECCLGGAATLTEMTISRRHALLPGDILLTCTDGIWSHLSDDEIASYWDPALALEEAVTRLSAVAISLSAPLSDNASATVLRWLG